MFTGYTFIGADPLFRAEVSSPTPPPPFRIELDVAQTDWLDARLTRETEPPIASVSRPERVRHTHASILRNDDGSDRTSNRLFVSAGPAQYDHVGRRRMVHALEWLQGPRPMDKRFAEG